LLTLFLLSSCIFLLELSTLFNRAASFPLPPFLDRLLIQVLKGLSSPVTETKLESSRAQVWSELTKALFANTYICASCWSFDLIAVEVAIEALPAIREFGAKFLYLPPGTQLTRSMAYHPWFGTVVSSVIALLIAVPVGLGGVLE